MICSYLLPLTKKFLLSKNSAKLSKSTQQLVTNIHTTNIYSYHLGSHFASLIYSVDNVLKPRTFWSSLMAFKASSRVLSCTPNTWQSVDNFTPNSKLNAVRVSQANKCQVALIAQLSTLDNLTGLSNFRPCRIAKEENWKEIGFKIS